MTRRSGAPLCYIQLLPVEPKAVSPLLAECARLEADLSRIRETNEPPSEGWYPYDVLANVPRLQRLLDAAGLTLPDPKPDVPVLDIGAADGHLSFLFERLGYEVEAIDHPATNYNWMNGIRQLAAYFNSSVRIHDINIDVWPYPPSGQYAFAMLLGILYHLRNPFCVLENLARRSPYLFMSTRLLSTLLTDLLPLPAVYLAGRTEINFDPTNYWLFTRRSIRRLLTRAGWEILSEYTERTRSAPFALSPSTRDERIYILARSAFTAQFAAFQCLDGWYPIEDGALRWTRREFAVRLHAAHQASRLVFEFFAHPYLLAQGPVTLQTRLEGAELNSYIIAKAGMHKAELSCVIEPNRSYAVAFALSGAIDEPGGERELGVRVEVFNTDHFGRPTPPPLRFE